VLYLLLPVAAASGWWIGRRGPCRKPDTTLPAFSSDYFKGLNFLLNEQTDKAIDVFVKMLEVDSDTVEAHLALGNLFRRRGEGERAIRIHQNLIARPSLSKSQRTLALFELGQDYLRAGLLDRAETLFEELLKHDNFRAEALEKLLDIYQQEKEWEKAIDVARRIEAQTGKKMNVLLAQFYCELGDGLRAARDLRAAGKMAKRALSYDQRCVRASLLQADVDKSHGDDKAAIKSLKQVEHQDADFLPEVIGPLLSGYQALGRTNEAEQYLDHLLEHHQGITPLLALAELLEQRDGEQVASERIVAFLRQRPSVRGLDRLIELHLENSDGAARENLLILKELTRRLLENKAPYRCTHCGFKAKTLQWQCPGCKQWTTVRPVQGVVGE